MIKQLLVGMCIVFLVFIITLSLICDNLYQDAQKWRRLAFESEYRPVNIVPMDDDKILGIVIVQKGKDRAENLFFPYPKKLNFSAMNLALDILGTTNEVELFAIKQKYGIK